MPRLLTVLLFTVVTAPATLTFVHAEAPAPGRAGAGLGAPPGAPPPRTVAPGTS